MKFDRLTEHLNERFTSPAGFNVTEFYDDLCVRLSNDAMELGEEMNVTPREALKVILDQLEIDVSNKFDADYPVNQGQGDF